MKIKDWIQALVRWCCAKPKKGTTVTPTQRQSYLLSAFAGSIVIGGQVATLTYAQHTTTSYTLTAGTGSLAVTGKDAGLSGATHVLGAARGALSLVGNTSTLRATRRMRASAGSFAITAP